MRNEQFLHSSRQSDIVESIVDLVAYPVHKPESDAYQQLLVSAREQLALVGCVRFSQFIKKHWQRKLCAETEVLAALETKTTKPYKTYSMIIQS